VRVADDGIGMTPATLATVFEPFVQADDSLARSKGGLGLGLALAKALVELHGGSVAASSAGPGKGSEFVIRLPVDRHPAGAVAPPPPPAASRRRRVLIVEDNADAADSLREILEFGDHDVTVAYDADQALSLARAFNPDVVLCDIGLPRTDGYDLARRFRADERLAKAFLIAVTGYASPEDVARATKAGFDRHLAKPLDPRQLAQLLAELPARAGSSRRAG
jgi:CheY-like chemotaxis protein